MWIQSHGANCALHKSDLRNWKNWNHFSEMVVARNNSPRNRQERRRSLLLVGRHEFQSESLSLSLSLFVIFGIALTTCKSQAWSSWNSSWALERASEQLLDRLLYRLLNQLMNRLVTTDSCTGSWVRWIKTPNSGALDCELLNPLLFILPLLID